MIFVFWHTPESHTFCTFIISLYEWLIFVHCYWYLRKKTSTTASEKCDELEWLFIDCFCLINLTLYWFKFEFFYFFLRLLIQFSKNKQTDRNESTSTWVSLESSNFGIWSGFCKFCSRSKLLWTVQPPTCTTSVFDIFYSPMSCYYL